jgi:hypothetical protein
VCETKKGKKTRAIWDQMKGDIPSYGVLLNPKFWLTDELDAQPKISPKSKAA